MRVAHENGLTYDLDETDLSISYYLGSRIMIVKIDVDVADLAISTYRTDKSLIHTFGKVSLADPECPKALLAMFQEAVIDFRLG